MTKAHYGTVEHDGGWSYQLEGTYSETFAAKAAAEATARRAAAEQKLPGKSGDFTFEDNERRWHVEHSAGDDRPDTDLG